MIDGFSFGFHVGFVGTSQIRLASNLCIAKEQHEILAAKLEKELCAVHFSRPPFDNFIPLPLGVVPKKSPGEFRRIHHLSYPDGSLVNYFIPVQYASITLIKSLGRACYMAKTDIKSAFCIIPIHPDDYHLLSMTWNNSYFFTGVCPWAVLRLALCLQLLALCSSGLLNIISVLLVFCIFWMMSCLLLPLKGNVTPI